MDKQANKIYLMTANNDLYMQLLQDEIQQNQFELTDNRSLATIVLADPPLVAEHLDVFEQEPLPQDHAFWHNDNITVTPHIAALSFPETVAEVFSQNLVLWQQEKPLNYLIDLHRGY